MITIQIEDSLDKTGTPELAHLEDWLTEAVLETLTGDDLSPALSLEKAGKELKLEPDYEVTLVLTDDEQLRALNLEFMGLDAPTDVLSFPAGEVNPETGALYLGDVIISYPQAVAQAEAGGHPVLDELRLLTVHGVLHLLGYDHADEGGRSRMWSRQALILSRLGNSITGPAS